MKILDLKELKTLWDLNLKVMIWNYFKIAWRNLKKDKTYTFLNLFGLSVAFGAAILFCIYALFQLSYDQFHENGDGIYQVYATEHTQKGTQVNITKPVPFAEALQEEVPGVEKITRYNGGPLIVSLGEDELRMQGAFVDPDLFSILWLSRKWIENYAYRDDLSAWIFLAAGAIRFIIALITVSFQSIRTATDNPVNSLKSK